MAYQVYFADLTEENHGMLLAILKLKEEAGTLDQDEAELLNSIRGSDTPTAVPPEEQPQRHRPTSGGGRRGSSRRGPRNHPNSANGS